MFGKEQKKKAAFTAWDDSDKLDIDFTTE